MKKYKLLIVDDAFFIRNLIKKTISKQVNKDNYEIEVIGEAKNAQEALMFLKQENPDIITVDYNMPPYENGIELIKKIKTNYPNKLILMISDDATIENSAKELGVEFLMKPFQDHLIWNKLDVLISNYKEDISTESVSTTEEEVESLLEIIVDIPQENKTEKIPEETSTKNLINELGFEIVGDLKNNNKPLMVKLEAEEIVETPKIEEAIEVEAEETTIESQIINNLEEEVIQEENSMQFTENKTIVQEPELSNINFEDKENLDSKLDVERLLNEIDKIFDSNKDILRDLKLKIEFLEYQEQLNNKNQLMEEALNPEIETVPTVISEPIDFNIELPMCDTEYPSDNAFIEEDEHFSNNVQSEIETLMEPIISLEVEEENDELSFTDNDETPHVIIPEEESLEETEEDVFDLLEEAIEDEEFEENSSEPHEPTLVDLFKENIETSNDNIVEENVLDFVGDEDEGAQDINEVIKEEAEEQEEDGLIIEEEQHIIDGDDFITFEEEDPEEYVDKELAESYDDLVIDFTTDDVEKEEYIPTEDDELEALIKEASYTLDNHIDVVEPEKTPKSILKLESDDLLSEILNDTYMDEMEKTNKDHKPLSEDELFDKMIEEFEASDEYQENLDININIANPVEEIVEDIELDLGKEELIINLEKEEELIIDLKKEDELMINLEKEEDNEIIIPQNEINFDDLLYDNLVIENEPIVNLEKEIIEPEIQSEYEPEVETTPIIESELKFESEFNSNNESTFDFDFDFDSIEPLVLDNGPIEEALPNEQFTFDEVEEFIITNDVPLQENLEEEFNPTLESNLLNNDGLFFNNNEGVTIAPPIKDFRNLKDQIKKEDVNNGREDGTKIKQNKSAFGKLFKK